MLFLNKKLRFPAILLFLTAVVFTCGTSAKTAKQARESARWFLTAAADRGKMDNSSVREKQLVSILDELARSSGELAVESSDLAREMQRLIAESGVSPARAASLRIKTERVIRLAGNVAAVTEGSRRSSSEVLARCRILAINPELNLVAIEAGSRSGVFKGMVFKTIDTVTPVELRISITNPDISGAVIVKGKMSDLAPGMSVTAIEHRKN